MDYTQEQLFRMQQFDGPRLPFYMSYPMQNLYLTEMEYEKDMDRMKELYPKEVKQITELVDEECDKMEYEGSLMFDEYPDRMMLERVTDRIYQRMQEKENSTTDRRHREEWDRGCRQLHRLGDRDHHRHQAGTTRCTV